MGETPDSPTLERRSSADRGLQTTTARVSRRGIPRRGKAEFDTHPCPARLDTFMAPTTVRPAPPAHVQSVPDAADSETRPLQSYFRQLARTEVMSQGPGGRAGRAHRLLARIDLGVMEHPVSLDQKLGKGASIGLLELLEDREQTAAPELIEHAQHVEQLHEVLDVLTPLEVDILRRRVGLAGEEEMTLKEIGARHSLSRERIRQLQEQALEKLRGAFRERG